MRSLWRRRSWAAHFYEYLEKQERKKEEAERKKMGFDDIPF